MISPAQLLTQATVPRPQHRALIYQGRHYDYSELAHLVAAAAASLQRSGIEPGSRLAIFPQPLLTLLVVLAAPKIGCSLMPLNPGAPQSYLQAIIDTASTTSHLISDAFPFSTGGNLNRHSARELNRTIEEEQASHFHDSPLSIEEEHLCLATSGSGAQARVVRLSGSNIMASVRASRRRLNTGSSDTWLCCLPLFHIGGLSIPLRCIEAGATLLLHERFDTREICDDLHRYAVTHISLVPPMLAMLLEQAPDFTPPKSLRVVLVGGASLPRQLYERATVAGWPLVPTYGMTENCSQIATLYPPPTDWHPGLSGKTLEHTEVSVDVRTGMISIRGEGVMMGYFSADGACVSHNHGEWFETGDLGAVDQDGNLTILGRGDEMLISGGENIHPVQIEEELLKHPGITEAAVIGKPDPVWGDIMIAVYVGSPTEQQLQQWCKQQLHGAWRPRRLIKTTELPRNAMHKIDRRALYRLAGCNKR